MLLRLKLDFRMRSVNSNLSNKFPAERGEEPGFDPFGLSDLFLAVRQDKERFLRKVSGLTLIFCQDQTEPIESGTKRLASRAGGGNERPRNRAPACAGSSKSSIGPLKIAT